MWYKIEREDIKFTITNTGENTLYLTLLYTNSYDVEENYEVCISESCVLPEGNFEFSIPTNKDGLYKLILDDKAENYQEVIIPQYNVILGSLIEDTDYVLCGCNCPNCGDCGEQKENEVLPVLMKVLSYVIINKNKYEAALASSSKCVEGEILSANLCYILNESITGNADNKKLLKQIIAYYYLVFYYTDILSGEKENLVKSKYKLSKIFPCIKKFGLNTECIKKSVMDSNNTGCPCILKPITQEDIDALGWI